MTERNGNIDRVLELAAAVCDGTATRDDFRKLDFILDADAEARRCYWDFCRMHVALQMQSQAEAASQRAWQQIRPTLPPPSDHAEWRSFDFLGNTVRGVTRWIPHDVLVANVVAAVLLALGLLAASFIYISPARHLLDMTAMRVKTDEPKTSENDNAAATEPSKGERKIVGRITGEMDCRWTRAEGRGARGEGWKIGMASGLLEITYDSGAQVILEGPCRFNVETNGGFLAIGRLTGRMEKKVGSGQWAVDSAKPQAASNVSTSHQPLATSHSFAIATPTAIVTDLGTEFGVEVAMDGQTTSHVFRGAVELRSLALNGQGNSVQRLTANESAKVERINAGGATALRIRPCRVQPASFVRKLASNRPLRSFSLIEMIAQDAGLSGYRQWGIDPATGAVVIASKSQLLGGIFQSDGGYHPVAGLKMIDGAFIPAFKKTTQLDSAKHMVACLANGCDSTRDHILMLNGVMKAGPAVDNPGFESPIISGLAYTQPFGSGIKTVPADVGEWKFSDSEGQAFAGLVEATSGFGSVAVHGRQCAFIQGTGVISQKIDHFADGVYVVHFWLQSRNRREQGQPIRVSIDGVTLTFGGDTTVSPTSNTTMTAVASDPIRLPAGSHTLAFCGTIPFSGGVDLTTFIDDVGIFAEKSGSNASSGETTESSELGSAADYPYEAFYFPAAKQNGLASPPLPQALAASEYALPNHASLAMWANQGVVFDLHAMRAAYPGRQFVRFAAALSNCGVPQEAADVFAFVDGQLRFHRRIYATSSERIAVWLNEGDRFLTLVCTDPGSGRNDAIVVFGDPTLDALDEPAVAQGTQK